MHARFLNIVYLFVSKCVCILELNKNCFGCLMILHSGTMSNSSFPSYTKMNHLSSTCTLTYDLSPSIGNTDSTDARVFPVKLLSAEFEEPGNMINAVIAIAMNK